LIFENSPMIIFIFISNKILFEPQRLQTLMSLYSSSLCGLVLLVPKRIRLTTADVKEGDLVLFNHYEFINHVFLM
jgi:hypothetical protein